MTITAKANFSFDQQVGNTVCGPDSSTRFYLVGNSKGGPAITSWPLERFDPAAGTWSTLAAITPTIIGGALAYGAWQIDSSNRLLYATGFVTLNTSAGAFQGTNRGYLYDPSTNTWTAITSLPTGSGRWEPHFWTHSGLLHLAGGYAGPAASSQDGIGFPTPVNQTDTWRYSGGTSGTWTNLSAPMNYVHSRTRSGYACPTDSLGKVYAIGGRSATGNGIASCERWNPTTGLWETIAALPVAKADYAWAVDPSDNIYVTQGTDAGNTIVQTTYRYNQSSNTWTSLAAHPNPGLYGAGFFVGGFFFVVGGRNTGLTTPAPVYGYNPSTDTWCATPDLLQDVQPYEMTPIADGAGGYYIPEQSDWYPTNHPTHVMDYYVPNTPDPCSAPPRALRGFAAVIGD